MISTNCGQTRPRNLGDLNIAGGREFFVVEQLLHFIFRAHPESTWIFGTEYFEEFIIFPLCDIIVFPALS